MRLSHHETRRQAPRSLTIPPYLPPGRRLDKLESNPELDTLRSYIAFALEKASCQQVGLCDLLDDELQLILSHVAESNGSPKQLLALSERKRQLAQQALAQGGALSSASTRLTADELVQFFR